MSKHFTATWTAVALGSASLRVALVALHLKAFPTDRRSCAQREAQALVARALIDELAADGALQRAPCLDGLDSVFVRGADADADLGANAKCCKKCT